MKNLNKKLYSVIIACLLMLCFTVVAMATEITDSSDVAPSSKEDGVDSSDIDVVVSSEVSSALSSEVSSNLTSEVTTSDNSEVITSVDSAVSSDVDSSVTSVESILATSSDVQDSSDVKDETSSVSETTSSSIINSNAVTSVESKNNDSSSANTTSKKSNYSNIGGVVNDDPDTSGWGDGQENPDGNLVIEDDTKKRKEKNITDYSDILWILIWIPILLILASVGALVYVNRKEFLQENSDFGTIESGSIKKKSAKEKAKRKNNHKNRTNVYRPRD